MVGMNGTNMSRVASAYVSQSEFKMDKKADEVKQIEKNKQTEKSKQIEKNKQGDKITKSNYGKTVGNPKLSEKAQKYYDSLKKKFGNYDFILVSSEEKENAKANAAKYANGHRMVVLIDEEKIEKMASDEKYRKQYENILSGAATQLNQLKASIEKTGAPVKGYGMQINDNGTASFFAVLKKSTAEQKARIERKAEEKKAEKKAAEKKKLKKEKEEEIQQNSEEVTISGDSIEELIRKIEEYQFNERSNSVQTEGEMQLGQNIDFKG